MRTSHLLKGAGRTALLAGLLLSGPALYFGSDARSAHDGPRQGHRLTPGAAAWRGPRLGHGDAAAQTGGQPSGRPWRRLRAHSGWPEPQQLGGDFSLTDHTGRKVTLADFKGKATAFYFGYTSATTSARSSAPSSAWRSI